MVEGNIWRTPTNEERQDYRLLGEQSINEVFLKQLAEVESTFTKTHKPFDSQCAKMDFADELEKIEKESERLHGFIRIEDIRNFKFDKKRIEEYGNSDRFKSIGDDEDMEMQVVTVGGKNVKKNVVVGHTVKYVCKRGHGCSVSLTEEEYGERIGKDKKKEEKK